PRALVDQRGDDADQGGLARPVRAEECEEIAGLDVEVDPLEGLDAVLVGLRQAADRERIHAARIGAEGAVRKARQAAMRISWRNTGRRTPRTCPGRPPRSRPAGRATPAPERQSPRDAPRWVGTGPGSRPCASSTSAARARRRTVALLQL